MGKLKSFGTFALPDYPAQTDIEFKEDDWVVGDTPKPYHYDTSKSGVENMKYQECHSRNNQWQPNATFSNYTAQWGTNEKHD